MPLWNKGKSKGKDWLDAHIGFDGPDCLIWPFAKNRGYGQFGLNNKMHKAHRVMCEMINGPAPPDKPHRPHIPAAMAIWVAFTRGTSSGRHNRKITRTDFATVQRPPINTEVEPA